MTHQHISFLRYPGGKQRQLKYFQKLLPQDIDITNYYIEPFVGGGSVFFGVKPRRSILADINCELIELYQGIKHKSNEVWEIYNMFGSTKSAYYMVRDNETSSHNLAYRAARTLYLNRTCFKGMWRYNLNGKFNVGYGGEDRRWVITKQQLENVAERLKNAELICGDFENIVDSAGKGDFLFLDPPYRPGDQDLVHAHYSYGSFSYHDQQRLATALKRAILRGAQWLMTNSSHREIASLYDGFEVCALPKGTGSKVGQITSDSKEIIIRSR